MMLCPVDQTQLAISNRQGIEIDYCPTCRGVWLDRGELDKIIERDSQYSAPQRGYDDRGHDGGYNENRRYDQREEDRDDRRRYDDDDEDHHSHHRKHKKEGFMSDLFDFG